MKSKILGLLAVGLLAGPTAANAVSYTYYVSGTFSDGGTVTGSFDMEPVKPPVCGSPTNVNITTTAGSIFAGTNYLLTDGCSGDGTETSSASFRVSFSYFLNLGFDPALTGTATVALNPVNSVEMVAATDASPYRERYILSGQVSTTPPSVPEPGTLALLGLGLVGLGFTRRKSA